MTKHVFSGALIASLLLGAIPAEATASQAESPAIPETDDPSDAWNDAEMAEFLEALGEAFRDDRPPPDAEKLAVAAEMVLPMIPDGSMAEVMEEAIGWFSGMENLADEVSPDEISVLAGVPVNEIAGLPEESLAAAIEIFDPYHDEREQAMSEQLPALMSDLTVGVEPMMREAWAVAYAHRLSLEELEATRDYFRTPEGAAFAREYMVLVNDPALAQFQMDFMVRLLGQMPEKLANYEFDDFPLPRSLEDLSEDELQTLADLLEIDPATLRRRVNGE